MVRFPTDVERTFADLTRSTTELRYKPKVTLAEGLSRFVSWFNRIWLLRLGWAYQWTWNHLAYRGIFAYLARARLDGRRDG